MSQELKWKIIDFLAEMTSSKSYNQIEPRTYVLFKLCFSWTVNANYLKIFSD